MIMNKSFECKNIPNLRKGCTIEQLALTKLPRLRYDPLFHQKHPQFSIHSRSSKPRILKEISQTPSPIKNELRSYKTIPSDHQLQMRFHPYVKAEITNKHSKKSISPLPKYDLAEELHKEFVDDSYSLGKLLTLKNSSVKVSRLPNSALTNKQLEQISLIKNYQNLEFKETKPAKRSKSPETPIKRKKEFGEYSFRGPSDWKVLLRKHDKNLPLISNSCESEFETELKRKKLAKEQISEEIRRDLSMISYLQTTPRMRNSSRSNSIKTESLKFASSRKLSPHSRPKQILLSSEDSSTTIKDPLENYCESNDLSPNYQNLEFQLYEPFFK
ncbi:unnamed protein product [Blepharisma stoltei]|uniref:Uncharacterized protein n=1 Tax=Blepharisma stoltei TaxID=1481888 RepID=A0AAU9IND8_9CILI|nr:unnamed protein product [Blepharisma stoltei]